MRWEGEMMNMEKTEIKIDGKDYVLKDSIKPLTMAKKGTQRYVIARTYSAGVFAGWLVSKKGKEVVLSQARRLWSWQGAASLSQLAVDGTSKPSECKFPVEVPRVELTETIELLDVSEKARLSIASVKVWQS